MAEIPTGGKEVAPKPAERETVITGVEVSEYQSGIPLKGWESVENALRTFSSGAPRASRSTESHQMKAVAESQGAFATGFYTIAAPHLKGGASFVDQMLEEAKRGTESQGRWHRSYDYDGVGSFFKTTVEVDQVKGTDGYILKLNAAYVGTEVEEGLAEHLGVERGLSWKNVTVGLEPVGDQFRADFEDVVRRLDGVIDYLNLPAEAGKKSKLPWKKGKEEPGRITGKDVVQQFLITDRYGDSGDPFILGSKDGIEVTIGMGRVGRRFEWQKGEKSEDRWHADGAVLTGPLDTDYRDETKLVPPSISISIRPESEDRYSRMPIVDPEKKELMADLAERVAKSFE